MLIEGGLGALFVFVALILCFVTAFILTALIMAIMKKGHIEVSCL